MYEHETFPRAPLTEALIDYRVTFATPPTFQQLDMLVSQWAERFPVKEERAETTVEFQMKAGAMEAHTQGRKLGYVLFSQTREKAVQIRTNGFAFSKLKSYENWTALLAETRELWAIYREMLLPRRVIRLAVRYINRLDLPTEGLRFQDYVLTGLELAPGVPQGVSNFFLRAVLPDPERDATANITSLIEEPTDNGKKLPYIFDIDAYTAVDLAPDAEEDIAAKLEMLRDYKNQIFFESMSEKAKEMFR